MEDSIGLGTIEGFPTGEQRAPAKRLRGERGHQQQDGQGQRGPPGTTNERESCLRISNLPKGVEAQPGEQQPKHGLRIPPPGLAAWTLLLAMTVILFAGTWRTHPLLSLAVPALALAVWWPALRSNRSERWLFGYVTGIYIYTILRGYADEIIPWRTDYVIQFDRMLFGGSLPSVELQRAFFHPASLDWLDVVAAAVHASFFVAPHVALVLVWRRWPHALRPHVLSALLTFFVGLALFYVVPTVPPWLASYQGEVRGVYRVINFVFSDIDRDTYRSLYRAIGEPNSVAAVPSIHMAITCLVLFRVRALAPRWTWPVAMYTALMGFSLVYLGEHYVFDVLVGVLTASVSELVVRRLEVRWAARQRLEPVPVRAA